MNKSPSLVDSHCHLNLLDYGQLGCSMDDVVNEAAANGVTHMLCVAVDLTNAEEVVSIAGRYDNVFASVGIHPNTHLAAEPSADDIVKAAARPRVVAIGETGLDYYRSEGDLSWQHERFRRHIAAAKQCGKPLIVHCRDAKEDTVRLLREERADLVGGVMHCFVDDWPTAKAALDLNFWISFSGIVTFKSADALREVAKQVPADRLLVETDTPYLAPVPHRGKTNRPAYVRHVAEFLAQLRGVDKERLAAETSANFFALFKDAAKR